MTYSNTTRMRRLYRERRAAGLCTRCGEPNDRDGSNCSGCLDYFRAWHALLPPGPRLNPGDETWLRPLLRDERERVAAFARAAALLLELDVHDPERLAAGLRRVEDLASAGLAVLAALSELARQRRGVTLAEVLSLLERRAAESGPRRAESLRALAARLAAIGAQRAVT